MVKRRNLNDCAWFAFYCAFGSLPDAQQRELQQSGVGAGAVALRPAFVGDFALDRMPALGLYFQKNAQVFQLKAGDRSATSNKRPNQL